MNAILCVDNKWGIGKNNGLLFSLPSDMKFFRTTTKNKIVVMGANTLKSFPNEQPLKNRINIVMSTSLYRSDCIVVRNMQELFSELKKYKSEDVYVIGGAKIYSHLFPYCDKIFVTKVEADGDADVFVENLDKSDFETKPISEKMNENGLDFAFFEYKNKSVKHF